MQAIENYTVTVANTLNQSIELEGSNPTHFGLTGVEGISTSQYTQNITTNSTYFGGTLNSTQILPRQMALEFDIIKNDTEQANRLYIEHFFNPLEDLDIIVSRLDTTRHIIARVNSFEIDQAYVQAIQHVTVDLTAPQPFFMDMSDYGRDIANAVGKFAPPYLMNATTGQIMGTLATNYLTEINNRGDVAVGLIARFVATDDVTNIKLFNARSEDEYVRVVDSIANGDVITISMVDGNKSIKKTVGGTTTNILHKLDRSSNFFKIQQGANVIGYDAETNKQALQVWIYYTPLYYGI